MTSARSSLGGRLDGAASWSLTFTGFIFDMKNLGGAAVAVDDREDEAADGPANVSICHCRWKPPPPAAPSEDAPLAPSVAPSPCSVAGAPPMPCVRERRVSVISGAGARRPWACASKVTWTAQRAP
eukprot:3675399-Prymnesium_polylepis.1